MLSATLALLMQVGPNPSLTPPPAIPPEMLELRRRQKAEKTDKADTALADMTGRLQSCMARAEQDSTAARTEADAWLKEAVGVTRAQALQCRGYAEANLGRWDDAAHSFLAARDAGEAVGIKYRARLGAMAANALLTAGDVEQALDVLDRAKEDSDKADFAQLGAEIELDIARAYVVQDNPDATSVALSAARELAPDNARAWLLSATFARRNDELATAQRQIEQASLLDPSNPEIGLEAGVIAVLSGKDDTARRDWQAVIKLAPGSPQASSAKAYLAQLDNP